MNPGPTKNLIVCCDGTGNRGGVTPDTNVYRVFNGIDRMRQDVRQIPYYDDGVGTERNKYAKALGGAMGCGFSKNVEEAYCFLCRNWQPGDRIFLFGFSRGAYTVRALAALIISAGILSIAAEDTEKQLEERSKKLRVAYGHFQSARRYQEAARLLREKWSVGKALYCAWYYLRRFLCRAWRYAPPEADENLEFASFCQTHNIELPPLSEEKEIQFIGVWDTVSAVGLPFDVVLKDMAESLINRYRFVDSYLSDRVLLGRQALSLDDQRHTFHPEVWNEWKLLKREAPPEAPATVIDAECARRAEEQQAAYYRCTNVDQAWFTGVHSNVGGGYPKHGLDYITLEWMVRDLWKEEGLRFKPGFLDEVALRADAHGRLYDSRSGLAAYYRYRPRTLREAHGFHRLACRRADGTNEKVDLSQPTPEPWLNLHESVLRRIDARTDGYDSGNLPTDVPIAVVDSAPAQPSPQSTYLHRLSTRLRKLQSSNKDVHDKARRWFFRRELLHLSFVMLNLLFVLSLAHTWVRTPNPSSPNGTISLPAPPVLTSDLGGWGWHYVLPLSFALFLVWVGVQVSPLSRRLVPWTAAGIAVGAILAPIDFLGRMDSLGSFAWQTFEFILPDVVAHALYHLIAQHPLPFAFGLLSAGALFRFRCLFRSSSEKDYERLNSLFRSARAP